MKRHALAIVVVMLVACGSAFVGVGSTVPLDAHEAFVARSAEEMMSRGDAMVPHFNQTPRLRKPPLNYWLVIGCDRLFGADGLVNEFEARLSSAIGGVLLVAMTIALGWILLGPATGLIGGLLVVTSSGYVAYTHSARPEMVYAALCTLGLVGFALATRPLVDNPNDRPVGPDANTNTNTNANANANANPWWAWLGWAAMGLATLSKGPQLPLIMIAGWLAGALWNGQFRETARRLRFGSGAVVYLSLATWWFVFIWLTVPNALEIWRLETIDRYQIDADGWWRIVEPYYLYRTAGLLLPWIVLYPASLLLAWSRTRVSASDRRADRLLSAVVFTSMIALSLSFGRRWYYMLPVLPVLALMMSAAAINFVSRLPSIRISWGTVVLGLHVVGVGAVAAIALLNHRLRLEHESVVAAMLVLTGLAAVAVVIWSTARASMTWRPRIAVVAVAGFVIAAQWLQEGAGLFWSVDRFQRRDFAAAIVDDAPHLEPLFGWSGDWSEQQYYLHRPIVRINETGAIESLVEERNAIFILVDLENPPLLLPESFTTTILESRACEERTDRLQLWRISRAVALSGRN